MKKIIEPFDKNDHVHQRIYETYLRNTKPFSTFSELLLSLIVSLALQIIVIPISFVLIAFLSHLNLYISSSFFMYFSISYFLTFISILYFLIENHNCILNQKNLYIEYSDYSSWDNGYGSLLVKRKRNEMLIKGIVFFGLLYILEWGIPQIIS